MQQTKGYFSTKGKIWKLNNNEGHENPTGTMRSLSFAVQTQKDNTIYVQVGKWANSKLNVKIKGKDMENVEQINEQDAINKMKDLFKDGDSVYISCRSDVNTYKEGRLDLLVNQIYLSDKEINFDDEDFKETNRLTQKVVIIERPEGDRVKVAIVDYSGKAIEQELRMYDEDIKEYFADNIKVGDELSLTLRVVNKPIYDNSSSESKEIKTLKKGVIKTEGKSKGRITGHESYLEIVDVELDNIEKKKYERSEIRETLENSKYIPSGDNNSNESTDEDDDSMPF